MVRAHDGIDRRTVREEEEAYSVAIERVVVVIMQSRMKEVWHQWALVGACFLQPCLEV